MACTLRYKLGLTGTKLGCDRAECAACTVLIGDVPHYSCSVLTHTVRDQKVLTLVGSGFVLRNPSVAITKPDIQKAHWNPCSSMMPCWTGCRVPSSFAKPSIVKTLWSRTVCVRTEHE